MNLLQERMSGTGVRSAPVAVKPDDIELIFDLTGVNADDERILEHRTFDRLLDMIRSAGDLIVLDMFLINSYMGGDAAGVPRQISTELAAALAEKMRDAPDTIILFITDPINSVYSSDCPAVLEPLLAAGGHIVVTDHGLLKDSNYLYSPFYRAIHPIGQYLPLFKAPILPNPLHTGTERVSLGQFFRLLNFKANHRKVAVIRDQSQHLQAMVTSWNPHSASSAHGNLAVVLQDGPLDEILRSELMIARSNILHNPDGCHSPLKPAELVRRIERELKILEHRGHGQADARNDDNAMQVEYVTEQHIGEVIDAMLDNVEKGDTVDMMIFYLADPGVIRRLRQAALHGATVRILMDPNKDAFGHAKGGIPNRPVGTRLTAWADEKKLDMTVRWFLTHGEQAHFKFLRVSNWSTGKDEILIGSANFTRRNLRGSNLEASVCVRNSGPLGKQAGSVFQKLWTNEGPLVYSAPFETFALSQPDLTLATVRAALGTTTGVSTY